MQPRDALHLEHLIGTGLTTMQTARPCLTLAEAVMLLVETMISAVVTQTWDATRDRMETLEEMFDRTGFFRKFK